LHGPTLYTTLFWWCWSFSSGWWWLMIIMWLSVSHCTIWPSCIEEFASSCF
jgi:hypothetical protein